MLLIVNLVHPIRCIYRFPSLTLILRLSWPDSINLSLLAHIWRTTILLKIKCLNRVSLEFALLSPYRVWLWLSVEIFILLYNCLASIYLFTYATGVMTIHPEAIAGYFSRLYIRLSISFFTGLSICLIENFVSAVLSQLFFDSAGSPIIGLMCLLLAG